MIQLSRATVLTLSICVLCPVWAEERSVTWLDPVGDAASSTNGAGDLIELHLVFDDTTGAYEVRFLAASTAPFVGNVEFAVNLRNTFLATWSPELAASEFHANQSLTLTSPQTEVTFGGTDEALTHWRGGHLVEARRGTEFGSAETGTLSSGESGTAFLDLLQVDAPSPVEPPPPTEQPHRIRIRFHGNFATCTGAASCAAGPFATLANTAFSGKVTLPWPGTDGAPDDPTRGTYPVTDGADFSLQTADPAFDIASLASVSVHVGNCIGPACAGNQDFMHVEAVQGGFHYVLMFSNPKPPFITDAQPDIVDLQATYAGFSLAVSDFSQSIDTADGPGPSPMAVSFERLAADGAVPATQRVPTLGAMATAVLGALLVLMGICQLRQRSRKSGTPII